MKKLLCVCLAALQISGCASLQPVPMTPGSLERTSVRVGDQVAVTTAGKIHRFEVTSLTPERLCGNDACVSAAEIQAIDRREVNKGETAVVVIALVVFAALLAVASRGPFSFPIGL